MSTRPRVGCWESLLAAVVLAGCNAIPTDGTLTRSEAKRILDRVPAPGIRFAVNLVEPYRQGNDAWLGELVRRGLITLQPGTTWDGTVQLIGGEKNYVPSYTNVLTEKGQRVMPAGAVDLHLMRTIQITGITMPSANTAVVQFTQTWGLEPVDGSIEFAQFLLSHTVNYVDTLGTPIQASAMFQKYDDGWRVMQ